MVAVIIDNFNIEVLMKVVNPRKGKCPTLEVDEPFMLWCPRRDIYMSGLS